MNALRGVTASNFGTALLKRGTVTETAGRTARAFVLTLFLCFLLGGSITAFGVVVGKGIEPPLPDNVPGIDRPFPKRKRDKFTFAILGDRTAGGSDWKVFDRAIQDINRLRPDFVVLVGDMIEGGSSNEEEIRRQWQEFVAHAQRIEVPLFFVPGNHDLSTKAARTFWRTYIGRTYYGFDYRGYRFLFLNTEAATIGPQPQFGTQQMLWLRDELEGAGDLPHVFLFMHRPAWRLSGGPTTDWQRIESWLRGVRHTVFAGHRHHLEYEMRNGNRYYIVGPTGAGASPHNVLELAPYQHYTLVTVDGEDVYVSVLEPGQVAQLDHWTRRAVGALVATTLTAVLWTLLIER